MSEDSYKDAGKAGVICADIMTLARIGENYDQLEPHDHGALFASIGALTERVQTLVEAIELRSNGAAQSEASGHYIHLEAGQ
jgi:hypothetical protein